MRIVHHKNLGQWSNNYLNTLISTVVMPRHFCYMNFTEPLICMTALQICGLVNDPSAQIRQKQYEMPDNLPDDLATIDIDAFTKLSDDNAASLVSPTPTALTPAAPLAASATPATPLAASARPATPLAASVTPATPCITDFSEVSVGDEIIRTCVTLSKVKEVEAMLKVERQRHLCALKLLHFFFQKKSWVWVTQKEPMESRAWIETNWTVRKH